MMVKIFERWENGEARARWGWEIWEDDEIGGRGEASSYPEAACGAWNFVEASRAFPNNAGIKPGKPGGNGRDGH